MAMDKILKRRIITISVVSVISILAILVASIPSPSAIQAQSNSDVVALQGPGDAQLPVNAGLNKGDIAWMMTASALVLVMTPGLGFFYGGMVRRSCHATDVNNRKLQHGSQATVPHRSESAVSGLVLSRKLRRVARGRGI
jgi:hypothetical protein